MIIDSHLHFPATSKNLDFFQAKKMLLEELRKNKIDYGLVIPDNQKGSPIGDLKTVLELTKNEKNLFTIGTINLENSLKKQISRLSFLFKKKKIRGLKIFPGHDPIYPTDLRLLPVYSLCQKHNRPVIIHTGQNIDKPEAAKYNQPEHILGIAKKFPKLNIIIAHYFWPKIEMGYKATRGFNNLYFDTSALADKHISRRTGTAKIKKFLELTVKNRPDSLIYGSDYACCDLKSHLGLISSLSVSEKHKRKIYCKNAKKIFKLNL